ncbi:hypothetical protein GCM10010503_33140 [Streptomyces lucensis JCM 4490]|uniref:Uncharacterized protein n=1 Tax=Streptomyces lucensis JCM 4490 TaxID=1306176 RepID=A0A918J715_9ACTN|nr:hypothetical protein [Streptomyces lucensis]GGW53305.1 hypothetical protein GCM10010503_33140 [Streptomyces lucensis JCM 4490]
MYLVHLHLGPHPAGLRLPEDTASVVAGAAPDAAFLRHATVHAGDEPALGLFLSAEGPEQAQTTARLVWWRAVAARPELGGWPVLGTRLALTPPDRTHSC